MGILDKVAKVEKQIEGLVARSDVPLQPIEIRRAALDEIEARVQPAGRARRVFPFNRVTVEVAAPDAARRAAVEAVLGAEALDGAVTERLEAAGCPRPADLQVRLRVLKRTGADWETGRIFRVLCDREAACEPTPASAPAVQARLVVVKGDATRRVYALTGQRTNIGRIAEVLDRERRVVRRNQVVFTEGGEAANQTVSRAHAHIVRSPSGDYRLFDDHSSYGTHIFRDGRTVALPSGSPRGTKLTSGDEIYVGQACLRFEKPLPE